MAVNPDVPNHLERLESFRYLEKDWNTYGAEPPMETAINTAIDLVNRLAALGVIPGKVTPDACGGVGLLWWIPGNSEWQFCITIDNEDLDFYWAESTPAGTAVDWCSDIQECAEAASKILARKGLVVS